MKTQLIQLEPHDDLISIRDKMTWSKTPRILLVWPIRERVNLRPLDLKLLQRHAATIGAQVGLVTTDGEIKSAARALGIPTFKTSSQARKGAWREQSRLSIIRRISRGTSTRKRAEARLPDPLAVRRPAARLGIFTLGVLAVLAIALVFVPSAEITLTPAVFTQNLTLPVSAAPDVDTVYLSGSLPARTVTVQVEAVGTRASSGSVSVPGQAARGQVRFSKFVFNAITIPAGTIVRTPDQSALRFATLQPVTLPEGEEQTATVEVAALDPGAQGNLEAGQLTAIEGGLGLSVTVENPEPTTGGTDILRPAPAEADLSVLREQLTRQMYQTAREEIEKQLLESDILFTETLNLVQVLEEESTPPVAAAGSQLTLRLRAEFQALYAASADLSLLAQSALDAALPAGYEPVSGSLTVSAVDEPVSGPGGVSRWQMRASRDIRTRIDPAQVVSLVRGVGLQEAERRLNSTFAFGLPLKIAIFPEWWNVLPYIPFRIAVK